MIGEATEEDCRLAKANKALFERVKGCLRGRTMTTSLYSSLVALVEDHRFEAAQLGIAYPQLVVVWLEGVRQVKLVRADIERRDLETMMVNWTVEHPTITAKEIALALARHFPGYRGGVPERRVA